MTAQQTTNATGYCYVSNTVFLHGQPIGYMYREYPESPGDSGWRFVSGDEPEEYFDEPGNVTVCRVDEINTRHPSILLHLDAPSPAAFARDVETGSFVDVQPRRSIAQKLFTVLVVVGIFGTLNYTILSCLASLPPYSWLVGWQMLAFGGHIQLLSAVAALFLTWIPLFLVLGLMSRLLAACLRHRNIPWVQERVSNPQMLILTHSPRQGEDPTVTRSRRLTVVLLILQGLPWGVGLTWFGRQQVAQAPPPPPLVELPAAAFYGAGRPDATYVTITGRLDWSHQVLWPDRAKGTEPPYVYVPLVPEGWKPEQPVVLLVGMPNHRIAIAEKQTASTGILERGDIPPIVRQKLAEKNVTVSESPLLLHWGVSPGPPAADGWLWIILGVGLIVASLGGGIWWLAKGSRPRSTSRQRSRQ